MQFKIDENLPSELVELLMVKGYDALAVVDQQLADEPDTKISTICKAEKKTIITLDVRFSDIRQYPPSEFAGTIALRLKSQDKNNIIAVFQRVIPLLIQESLIGHLWIVHENKIRIRN